MSPETGKAKSSTGQKTTLEQRVLGFIQKQRLVSPGDKLIVAVSGGADSVCLLRGLFNLRKELDIALHIAHLDHQLRDAESEADARYIANLAHQLELPATLAKRDVKAYQLEHRLSPEEAAREVRYTFLSQVAESVGAGRVAVGHTGDDHVETILMHLIRGAGTRGLRGLQPISRWQPSGLTVIRPLLEISRQETGDYCQEHGLTPRVDASNLSLSPFRNRIRLELLPRLRSYNPRIAEALVRTARACGDDLTFLDESLRQLWGEIQPQDSTVVLDRKRFAGLPPAMQRHLLRLAIEKLSGNLKDIEAQHIERIMASLDKPAGKTVTLPGGLRFLIEYDRYLISPDAAALSPFPVLEGEVPLKVPGKTQLPGWCVDATVEPPAIIPRGAGQDAFTACFDFDKAGNTLTIRHRQAGDRFQPFGMSQPKKLGEFMIDARIPRAWRERVPIIGSPVQVLWVVGWRIDERVKVTDSSKRILCLRVVRE